MNRFEIRDHFIEYIESMRGFDLTDSECERIIRNDMKTFDVSLSDFEIGCLVQWICG